MAQYLTLVFFGTLCSVLFSLIYLWRALNVSGHFSRIILIGLPKDPQQPEMGSHTFQEYIDSLKDFTMEDAIAFAQSPAVIASAVVIIATLLFTTLKGKRKPVLDPSKWQEFPLIEKTKISPNTAIYRFALPDKRDVFGLPIGQHISISAEIAGKEIMRSYTPISSDDDLGHFDLLIKSYEMGNISRLFSLLKIGDKIRVKGPKGNFNYHPTLTGSIGMIAGGTGITPVLQIIRAVLKNPLDRTQLSLIYANVNEEDILLRSELEDLARRHPNQFKVYYVLNNPPPGWTGGVGFVSKEQIQTHLPKPTDNCKILMCGPPPMITAMKKHLDELKYPAPRTVSKLADQIFIF
ncbi:nadh-cytochrome b5 reductase [Moniliophthora roreri]|uniref:NADH-cytochrome b5 reductase n=1 Tax=Moniliophthora roreri TaxID=221103 RepID=A0A0W0F8N7_MONRR|nr:nadh-cytochrome b5 reductase [Moniliophthora roreri]